jgi:hypothetical protein
LHGIGEGAVGLDPVPGQPIQRTEHVRVFGTVETKTGEKLNLLLISQELAGEAWFRRFFAGPRCLTE